MQLRNRVLMGSMHTGLEEAWGGIKKLAAFYGERARGGVGLIVTGGTSPNIAGRVSPFSAQLTWWNARFHRQVTDAVHRENGKIALQILHAGRYAYHPLAVGPSSIKSPISPFRPRALSTRGVERTIHDFVVCAARARDAGYDGVEVMGSEGYLINQFIAARTNHRKDAWGGAYENRILFPIEIVRRIREKVGKDFLIIYRLSMLDLVDEGSNWEEVVQLGKQIEAAGANIINTGIGWHEARIPTIATMVPRAAFSSVTQRMKAHLRIPLVTANRINTPEVAESILAKGEADMVSMARPFLADPEFVNKAASGRADEINTCIACNQACLDHIFSHKRASCMVNPRACYETELNFPKVASPKRIAVVGAGPAGMSFATTAAERGHQVTLWDADTQLGGQFNLARRIPGKEEFAETIRYFRRRLEILNVDVRLGVRADAALLSAFKPDRIVLATGVTPRRPAIPGIEHPKAVSYFDVLLGRVKVGKNVAIIGAGGIGFDVAEFLAEEDETLSQDPKAFAAHWGYELDGSKRGGVEGVTAHSATPARKVYLLQRTEGRLGSGLAKTTGWIHRTELKNKKVIMIDSVTYEKIDEKGLHIDRKGKKQILEVDHVVICAGQESRKELGESIVPLGIPFDWIGGADVAAELDAKRAIRQGTELATRV